MYDLLEEVIANKDVKRHDSDDSICILDPILINLDEEGTLNDVDDVNDEYGTIFYLPNMISLQLILTPSI